VPIHGILSFDKPVGVTSRDAVDRVQTWFRGVHCGHAGTLDPLAQGVLLIALGKATRLIEEYQELTKTYRARLQLGLYSTTDDAEGEKTPVPDVTPPALDRVLATLARFVGEIEQVPPAYSAVRAGRHRAYALARSGQMPALTPRRVRIEAIECLNYCYPSLEIEVRCGKGTYIRSLARDLGQALGCGAYLDELTRTRIGPFVRDRAVRWDDSAERARAALVPVAVGLPYPTIHVGEADLLRLSRGQAISPTLNGGPSEAAGLSSQQGKVLVLPAGQTLESTRLVILARWDAGRRALQPDKVLELD